MRQIHGLVAIALIVPACVLATAPALAQRGRAKSAPKSAEVEDPKLKSGLASFNAGDHRRAAREFERVYAATKEPRALFWMGRALEAGGELASALRTYKKCLAESEPSPDQTRELIGMIQTLTMQVAMVTVNAPAGATITVDGVVVGTAPLDEPLYVDPGKRTIGATKDDKSDAKVLDAQEEGRMSVDLLAAADAKAADPEPRPTPARVAAPAASSSVDWPRIVGLGTSALLATGSVYFGIKAAGTASDLDARRGDLGVSRSDLDALQAQTRLEAGLSVGLGLGALGVAAVTLFAFKRPSASGAAAAPSKLIVTGRGVVFAGSF